MNRNTLARAAVLALLCITETAIAVQPTTIAQAGPSWGPADNRGSALQRSPDAVNRTAGTTNVAVANPGVPPKDRDCQSQVTRPERAYSASFNKFPTDGTQDHGQILNVVVGTTRVVESDLEDLQVRIEQVRCEDQNIKAKLDYLIRMRAQ